MTRFMATMEMMLLTEVVEKTSFGGVKVTTFSRLFGGVHINSANIEGVEVGQQVGNAVINALG